MYPAHTGSILLDIAYDKRHEEIVRAARSRRAASFKTNKPTTRPPKRPWWWGLARSRRTA
ncbi:MAG: hypothetical protein ABJA81_02340 [Nocardioidaceae bacterium]